MLLSAGRPSEIPRTCLTFTVECVSEMRYYTAERLPFKRIHVQIFFQTIPRHVLSFHDHFLSRVLWKFPRNFSILCNFFELYLYCQVNYSHILFTTICKPLFYKFSYFFYSLFSLNIRRKMRDFIRGKSCTVSRNKQVWSTLLSRLHFRV